MFLLPNQKRSEVPCIPPCSDQFVNGVATKDVPLPSPLWARLFLPNPSQSSPSSSSTTITTTKPMPVVLYIHGGGYCTGDPRWPPFHNFCSIMAAMSRCVWVSLAYRLAPEHRLPAAYDDGLSALHWLQTQAQQQEADHPQIEPWFAKGMVDFGTCFLAGESAGASIVINVALRAAACDLCPLRIRGLLLIHPGIHSEAKRAMMNDDLQVDRLYAMALPEGADFDYPPVNLLNPKGPSLSALSAYRSVLLAIAGKDFRCDLTMQFYEKMKNLCEEVQLVLTPGKGHAFHVFEPDCEETLELCKHLADFITTHK